MNSNDLLLDHFHHPKNFGRLEGATHSAETENLSCGDRMTVDIVAESGIIERVGWTGAGCALSQGSASILSEHLVGMPIEAARKISGDDVLEWLGMDKISPTRLRCALLALETVRRALGITQEES